MHVLELPDRNKVEPSPCSAEEAGIVGPLVSVLITNYLNLLDQVRAPSLQHCVLGAAQERAQRRFCRCWSWWQ